MTTNPWSNHVVATLRVTAWVIFAALAAPAVWAQTVPLNNFSLPPGATVTFTFDVDVDNPLGVCANAVSNQGAVTGTGINVLTDDPDVIGATNPTVTALDVVDLAITKTDGAATEIPGTTVTYTIQVSNAGPLPAQGATVSDTFPASLSGVTWTCIGAGGGTCTAAGSGNISDLVNIPVGGSATYTVNATISAAASGTLVNTATISKAANQTECNLANNSASDTDTLTPQVDLAITKTDGLTSINAGAPTSYTITVTNAGPSDAIGATVADVFPAALLTPSWTCVASALSSCSAGPTAGNLSDNVTARAGGTLTYTVNATVSGAFSGNLSNTATVAAPGGSTDTNAGNNSAIDQTSVNPVADLSISKTNGVTSAVPGLTTTYTMVASNAGPATAVAASVSDSFPAACASVSWTCVGAGGGTCTAGPMTGNLVDAVNLPANGTATYTAVCTLASNATGTLINTATISGGGISDTNAANNTATDSDTLVAEADLSISKTNGAATAIPGAAMTYTIVASNAGPSSVGSAAVTDTFPASITGINWTCAGAAGGSCPPAGSGNLNETVGLPPGGSVTFTATGTLSATATGTLSNTATVASSVSDLNTGNNSATDTDTLVPNADLSISKTNGTTISTPGSTMVYTIVASNAGPSSVSGATVADTFPASLSCTWTCAGAGGGSCTAAGSGHVNDTVNLPSGGSTTYTASCTIDAGATGTLSNTATVTAPGGVIDPPGNNSASDSDTLNPQADVSISKTDGQTSVNAGTSTTYTITASNAGPSNAPSATLADSFPALCVSPSWTCSGAGGGTCAPGGGGNINENVNLPAGGAVSFTATCPIISTGTGTLSNTATVTLAGGVTDPVPANNSATDTGTVIAVPLLSINSVGRTEDDSGSSNLTFTVTRTTTGTAFEVDYATADGAAVAGSDYTATAGTLNFAADGASTQTINVPIIGDHRVEDMESFTLTLSNPTGNAQISGGGSTGMGSITDNDSATVQFAPVSVNQSEGSSPMAFSVTLSNPVQSGVTLAVNSTPGSATSPDDFTAIGGGTLVFAPNSNASQTVNVVIIDDALDEDDEAFTLSLSNLLAIGDVTLPAATATATGTIVDDDATPTLSVSDLPQPEGNAVNTLTLTGTLSAISGRNVSFSRATQDGTAVSSGPSPDFVALPSAQITIPAGTQSVQIPITINGDTAFEGDESFTLNLTSILNATPGSLSATATLLEDDQQPTTTTITSDEPDASLVGQPYTVNVSVAAQTLSPSGTISVSDGTVSCGPVNLTSGTSPNGSASCQFASTSAGSKTLSATYTPSSTAFAASNASEPHQVNPASTTLSVTGPARVRINSAATYTISLNAVAPGGGTPAGTVTVSEGSNSCTITLPASTCDLSFASLGSRTISASYAGNANYLGSTSSGSGNASTLVFALSDVQVSKSNGDAFYEPGDLQVYTIQLRNGGPDVARDLRLLDSVPAELSGVQWSCDASGGASCPLNGGTGNIDQQITTMPLQGLLNYTLFGTVVGSPVQISNTASVQLPSDTTVEDPTPGNNSATDVDQLNTLFRNGFEAASINAANGNFQLPSAALRSALDNVAVSVFRLDDKRGSVLRIYARLFDGEIEYALATRTSVGWQLGIWQRFASDPTLRWTATPDGEGWRLQSATLQ